MPWSFCAGSRSFVASWFFAYAIMSNHFHIFIYVPEPEEIDDGEILRRINALYRDASLSQVLGKWKRLEDEEADLLKRARPTKKLVSRFGEYRTSFLRRMWNSSEFMRTFKQHFTMSFNGRRDHHGTMFEGRYHERNHKPEPEVMWKTSAYIDINAWEAGIVKRPEDYEWCSFAAAVKGDEKARRGYAFMYGNADDWDVIRDSHEKSMREAMSEILAAREREKEERVIVGCCGRILLGDTMRSAMWCDMSCTSLYDKVKGECLYGNQGRCELA